MAAAVENSLVQMKRPTLTEFMADKHHLSGPAFLNAIRATVFKEGSNEQLCAFLMVAEKYDLDPITREIYAFPTKGGGIMPIVSIDGWSKMCNQHPNYDGCEFVDKFDAAGKIVSITCKMFRKDRSRPNEITEYYAECYRPTEPWNKWPVRMLRWKAFIQCARITFSFTGIYDPDEASRIEPSLGPVIDAQEYGATIDGESPQGVRIKELFEKLEYTQAQARNASTKYANSPDKLIEWLESQLAKKANDGGAKPDTREREKNDMGAMQLKEPIVSNFPEPGHPTSPEQAAAWNAATSVPDPPAKEKPKATPPAKKPAPVAAEDTSGW